MKNLKIAVTALCLSILANPVLANNGSSQTNDSVSNSAKSNQASPQNADGTNVTTPENNPSNKNQGRNTGSMKKYDEKKKETGTGAK